MITLMKKTLITILTCLMVILTLMLTACGDNTSGDNFPNSNDMRTNLERNGYTVSVTTDLDDKEGTHLSAKKSDEYIEFYWLENLADADYFYEKVKNDFPDYTAAAEIVNDETFGIVVYCGTVTAAEDAGIKTIVIKGDFKV